MIKTHNLGFPRIGEKRELKFALEAYWKGNTNADQLNASARALRANAWKKQTQLDFSPVGDFSFYDQVLDMSETLGNIPARALANNLPEIDQYFLAARGRSQAHAHCFASEMTKWFDTNYHYLVPEFSADTEFSLDPKRIVNALVEAQSHGVVTKPVLIGPVTYLWLGKSTDQSNRLDLLERLLPAYTELLTILAEQGVDWVQLDEPILVTELSNDWKDAFNSAYQQLKSCSINILLATYFGELKENLKLALELPTQGIHIDAVRGKKEVTQITDWLPSHKILSLGVVNGRNIWKTDLTATLQWLEPVAARLKNRLWLAPSCSLLHVPVNLENETNLNSEVVRWLAFAEQKIDEIVTLAKALNEGRKAVTAELADNAEALKSRRESKLTTSHEVRKAVAAITPAMKARKSAFDQRAAMQDKSLDLPLFPTTTIGSFPQTAEIRNTRKQFKQGTLSQVDYQRLLKQEIQHAVAEQEKLGLDVFVHGEAERNDMVEYFGEQLEGYIFSSNGWVQSYGSRCVKPPILFGDISRKAPMTVEWITYAQSLTEKPMKGMLTGPVTMLNWSFVRDDQPLEETCIQLALAIRQEVQDLEQAGVNIIQIDEAALREGLPLRKSDWNHYLDWSINAFKLAANGVKDQTQIHTHMCYSEFNDIIESIANMDADVITIETSRSNMELLDAFNDFDYPNQIGPGVYDIHTPNIPRTESMIALMEKATQRIPAERLWVNPDCGLKTRQWGEVIPSLQNMVHAAKTLRTRFSENQQIQANVRNQNQGFNFSHFHTILINT